MSEIELVHCTGNQRVDSILRGVIGFCELVFPERILGYYLQGSYAAGDATAVSDIDLVFVFQGDFTSSSEKEKARRIDSLCEWLVGRQLDILPTTEAALSSTK